MNIEKTIKNIKQCRPRGDFARETKVRLLKILTGLDAQKASNTDLNTIRGIFYKLALYPEFFMLKDNFEN
jgi:hypothetical protein